MLILFGGRWSFQNFKLQKQQPKVLVFWSWTTLPKWNSKLQFDRSIYFAIVIAAIISCQQWQLCEQCDLCQQWQLCEQCDLCQQWQLCKQCDLCQRSTCQESVAIQQKKKKLHMAITGLEMPIQQMQLILKYSLCIVWIQVSLLKDRYVLCSKKVRVGDGF